MMLTIIMRRGNLAKAAAAKRLLPCGFAAMLGLLALTGCGPPGPRALHRGDRLVQEGQFEEAIPPLNEAVSALAHTPAAARAWNLLGVAEQGAGHALPAFQAYQQALKLDRNLAIVDYNIGCLQMQQSNFPAAITALTTYTTLRSREPDGFMRLGDAYMHLGLQSSSRERARQFEAARVAYETAEKLSPSPDSLNALGLLELQRRPGGPPSDAIKYAVRAFQAALARSPDYPPALLNLAILDQQYLGDPKGALERYHQYLALQPPPPRAGDVDRIARQLEMDSRIQIIPHSVPRPAPQVSTSPIPTNLASTPRRPTLPPAEPAPRPSSTTPERTAAVLTPKPSAPPPASPPPSRSASANETAAVTQVPTEPKTSSAPPVNSQDTTASVPQPSVTEPSSTLDAGTPQSGAPPPKKTFLDKLNPRNWLGGRKPAPETSKEGSVPASARDRYAYPLPITPIPGNRAAAQRLVEEGNAAQRAGRPDEAAQDFQKAADLDSTYFQAALSLGLASIDAKDYATALTSLDRALKLEADSADARYAFAWVLQKKNYYQDAAEELEKLLSQHPEQVRAHLLLGNLYAQKLNQSRLARDHYLRVLELDPQNSQAQTIRNWLTQTQ